MCVSVDRTFTPIGLIVNMSIRWYFGSEQNYLTFVVPGKNEVYRVERVTPVSSSKTKISIQVSVLIIGVRLNESWLRIDNVLIYVVYTTSDF